MCSSLTILSSLVWYSTGNLLAPIESHEENEVLWICPLELHSQHLIFFVTYKKLQLATVFVPNKPFHFSVIQHSSLLGPYESYKENEVLRIRPLELNSVHFLCNLQIVPNKRDCFPLACFSCKCVTTLQLTGPIRKLQRKWSVVNAAPRAAFTTPHFLRNLQKVTIS